MHAVLDHDEVVTRCQLEGRVEVHGIAERVLQQQDLRLWGDAALGLFQVDVVALERAVDIDGPCPRVPDRIRHDDVRGHL